MTEGEAKSLVYVCPYHGRRSRYDKTKEGLCKLCIKRNPELKPAKLRRVPYKGHAPRWQYDCARCKFAWCCGPQCACHIKGKMPKQRKRETDRAARMFQEECKREQRWRQERST